MSVLQAIHRRTGFKTETSPDQLRQAVESQHGGRAKFVQDVPVHEKRGGQTVWDGTVHVFDLKGSTSGAFRAYAWSDEPKDGDRSVVAVLHTPNTCSPTQAVRAILAKRDAND